jgi:hypothetical protein
MASKPVANSRNTGAWNIAASLGLMAAVYRHFGGPVVVLLLS